MDTSGKYEEVNRVGEQKDSSVALLRSLANAIENASVLENFYVDYSVTEDKEVLEGIQRTIGRDHRWNLELRFRTS